MCKGERKEINATIECIVVLFKFTMKLLFTSAFAAILPATIHAYKWKWSSSSATCTGDPFRNVALNVTCTHNQYYTRKDPTQCGVGDTAFAKGSLEATMAFGDGQVIVTPSVSGIDAVWDKKVYGHLSDWLYPVGGQTFGEQGFYTISYSISLPKESGSWPGEGWVLNNLVTGHIIVKNAGYCASGKEEEWYPVYSYSMVGLMMCSAVATGFLVKKAKRNCAQQLDDDYAYNANAGLSYYEMTGGSSSEEVL